jgi:hypothetical protein
MSWSNTWSSGLAIGLDYMIELTAFWRVKTPMTVSSMCGLSLRKGELTTFLALLGRGLNWLNPGHCEAAIVADRLRAKATLAMLE